MCWCRTARDGGKSRHRAQGVARLRFHQGRASHAGSRPETAAAPSANSATSSRRGSDERPKARHHGQCRRRPGGTKPNVIAEEAYAEVDLRVPSIAASDEMVAKILGLKSKTDGVSVKVVGELNRPPYEKGNAGAALYEHAKTLAPRRFDLVECEPISAASVLACSYNAAPHCPSRRRRFNSPTTLTLTPSVFDSAQGFLRPSRRKLRCWHPQVDSA